MGVSRGFWDVLKPVAHMESLDSLRGKVLAIDLSFWMIQLLTRVKGIAIRKPHIRLLFFRTIHLVAKVGAFPVFVADGEPPPLKLQVRLNRFSRISGVPSNTFVGGPDCNIARSAFFTENVGECVELLELLGMPVLRAKHEAEGLCAELQRQGLVNACVTPDSDAFLYGATHVIKILNADLKDPHVESYIMGDIESFLGLQREHLVALALLAGCDYNVTGVPGIGCQNAVRLIKGLPQHQVFDRLRDWGAGHFDEESGSGGLAKGSNLASGNGESGGLKSVVHCSSCGHLGTKTSHAKFGCRWCKMDDDWTVDGVDDEQGCRPKGKGFKCTCEHCNRKEALKKDAKQKGWHVKLCQKLAGTVGFPNEDIIKIFMNPEHDTLGGDAKHCLAWKSPRLEALEEFLGSRLRWDRIYIRQKVLPLLSFYCLKDTAAIRRLESLGSLTPSINGIYVPHSIQRVKILFSKPLFRLRWTRSASAKTQEDWLGLKLLPSSQSRNPDDGLDLLALEVHTESLDNTLLFTTDEDMTLVKEAYPDLVSKFEQEQDARKNKKKGELRNRKKNNVDSLSKTQLRITAFFQAKKGGDARAVVGTVMQDGENCWVVPPKEEAEPRMKIEEAELASGGDMVTCKMRSVSEVIDKCCKDENVTFGLDHPTEVEWRTSTVQDSESKALVRDIVIIEDNGVLEESKLGLPDVLLIDDMEMGDAYPHKAHKHGDNSPRSPRNNKGGLCFWPISPPEHEALRQVINVDTTPPLTSWRKLYEDDDMRRACSASARRVLFR